MRLKRKNKPRRHKGPISLEDKLDIYWRQNKKKLLPKILISLVSTVQDYQLIRKRALREFLTKARLNFYLFDLMVIAAKDILNSDKKIKKEFLKQCFAICTENNLVELGEEGIPEAVAELFLRIKSRSISKRNSLQTLIRFFGVTTSPEGRIIIWKEIEKLDPDDSDLKDILELVSGKSAFYKVSLAIEKYMRKRTEKKGEKIINRIKELIKEINLQKKQRQE